MTKKARLIELLNIILIRYSRDEYKKSTRDVLARAENDSLSDEQIDFLIEGYEAVTAFNERSDIEKILEEIFAQSPLPNRLKQPKKEWKNGKMRETQKVRIVEEYSSYKCKIIGFIPEPD